MTSIGDSITATILPVYTWRAFGLNSFHAAATASSDAVTVVPVPGASVLVECILHKAKINFHNKVTNKPERFL